VKVKDRLIDRHFPCISSGRLDEIRENIREKVSSKFSQENCPVIIVSLRKSESKRIGHKTIHQQINELK
jgi:hypothetical protein